MPGLTPAWSLPYPLYTEPVNGAAQIQALAEQADDSLVAIQANITAASTRVLAQATGTNLQSIPNAASTAMQYNTETFDSDNMINLGTDNTVITVTVAGIYLVVAECEFAANATGSRELFIVWSGGGAQFNYASRAVTGDVTRMNVAQTFNATIGQTFRANVFQSSGAALNSSFRRFSAVRVSG
jgi:hypothetical protein